MKLDMIQNIDIALLNRQFRKCLYFIIFLCNVNCRVGSLHYF